MAIVETFLYFGIGAVLFHCQWLDQNSVSKMSRIAIDVLLPFLTFSSVIKGFSSPTASASALWQLPLIGVGIMSVGCICGYILQYGIKNSTDARLATFRHLCVANNYLFLPLIVISSLYGLEGTAYLLVMNIGSTIAFWTLAILVMGSKNWNSIFHGVFSTNTFAAIGAVIVVLLKVPIPNVMERVCLGLGSMSVPLMLLLIGASLYITAGKLLINIRDLVYMTAVRLIIIPVILVMILKWIPLDSLTYNTALVVSVMPASCASVLIVKKYGACGDFAGQVVFFTTILSFFTIPLLLYIL